MVVHIRRCQSAEPSDAQFHFHLLKEARRLPPVSGSVVARRLSSSGKNVLKLDLNPMIWPFVHGRHRHLNREGISILAEIHFLDLPPDPSGGQMTGQSSCGREPSWWWW